MLVDTGPPEGGVVGRLRRAGVRRLDVLVVTHAEADHAAARRACCAALPVGAVLDGRDGVRSARRRSLRRRGGGAPRRALTPAAGRCSRRRRWRCGSSSPRPEAAAPCPGANPNDRAIVLEATAAGARVLLPADAESPVLAGLDLRRVDVLKVTHHGSADAGLAGLLAGLRAARRRDRGRGAQHLRAPHGAGAPARWRAPGAGRCRARTATGPSAWTSRAVAGACAAGQ